MATKAFRDWDRAGRPFRRPPWLAEQKARAIAAAVAFLGDLGNRAHLEDDNPEDHTPYSFTAWPIPLLDYVICALDLGKGAHGDRILADARAGRLPWLKYMNHRGLNWSRRRGNFQIGVASGDDHLHLSGMSDHTRSSSGTYNPYVAGGSMPNTDNVEESDANYQALIWRVEALVEGRETVLNGPRAGEQVWVVRKLNELAARPATVEMSADDRAAIVGELAGIIGRVRLELEENGT